MIAMSRSLSCSAEKCVHNVNKLCSAYKIHVNGHEAHGSSGTQCDTFAEKGFLSAVTNLYNMNVAGEFNQILNSSNSNGSMSPKVECEAVNCNYNSNKYCTANDLQISGINAASDEDTRCETFVD
jgi:Domain of Unknown Function (DUF1540).